MEEAYRRKVITADVQQEVVYLFTVLGYVCSEALVSETCIRTILGPKVQPIYALLGSILSSAPARMDWDTVGFLRLSLLPSLDNIMEGMRDIFGGEHAFGPLPTHLDYEESGQNYFGLFTTICRLRDINCCENVDCREFFPDIVVT